MTSGSRSLPTADLLVCGASELLTCAGDSGSGTGLGRIPGGVVAIAEDRVIAAGPESEVRRTVILEGARVLDAGGGVVAPGFVDAHTHLVFGGTRMAQASNSEL